MTAVRGNTVMVIEARTFEAPAPRPVEEIVVPICERVTIMELREAMCRWPLGDPSQPDFRYCGARSDVGASYCAHHSRMAYQPAQDRRRERERRAQQMQRLG
jgi:GcrA cell cycle regulator